MGNLNSDMTGSQITATLNLLSGDDGVTADDTLFLRQFPGIAQSIIEGFKRPRKIYQDAAFAGGEIARKAARGVVGLGDFELIEALLGTSEDEGVLLEIIAIFSTPGKTNYDSGTKQHLLHDIAAGKYFSNWDVQLVAAEHLSDLSLQHPDQHWHKPGGLSQKVFERVMEVRNLQR